MPKILSVALVLGIAATPVAAQTPPPPPPAAAKAQATAYAKAAGMSDLYEITSSKLALQRSRNDDVRRFAQMMIDHHTKMSNEFKAALKAANIAEPAPTLDDRRQGMLNNLKAAGDADFDAAYLHQQLAAHLEALTLHKTYASRGDNATLKALAEKAQPVVQSHIDELRRIGGDALKDAAPGDGQ